jgi:hypothetical protein
MSDAAEFLRFWQSAYPQTPPVDYLFKRCLTARWARIHSLPDSKRYADTPDEWETLLNRQRAVIRDLLRGETEARMVVNSYTASHPLPAMLPVTYLGTFSDEADPEPSAPVHAHLVTANLSEASLTPVLKRIANDELRAFIIGKTSLVAPYDGGVDLVLETPAACAAFKKKYARWLSGRPDGL